MAPVRPVHPAGMAHNVTARARLVITVTAAWRSVHGAGTVNPVTRKLGNVGGVTLDGRDPGVHTFDVYVTTVPRLHFISQALYFLYMMRQCFLGDCV